MLRKFVSKKNAFIAIAVLVTSLVAWFAINKLMDTNVPSNKGQSAEPTSSNDFTFQELGVKIPLPNELEGLQYEALTPPGGQESIKLVRVYTKKYTELINRCFGASSNTIQAFATLTRTTGSHNPDSPSGGIKILKQFDGFYISDLGPSLPNDVVCRQKEDSDKAREATASLSRSLSAAFKEANATD